MIGISKIIAVKWGEAEKHNIPDTDAEDQIWLFKEVKKSKKPAWTLGRTQ